MNLHQALELESVQSDANTLWQPSITRRAFPPATTGSLDDIVVLVSGTLALQRSVSTIVTSKACFYIVLPWHRVSTRVKRSEPVHRMAR